MNPATRPRDVILPEEDFALPLREESREFGAWAHALVDDARTVTHAGALTQIEKSANDLETFLDDHGARSNREYAPLRELVASVRGLSHAATIAVHLGHRVQRYRLQGDAEGLGRALEQARIMLAEALGRLGEALVAESERLGLEWRPGRGVPGAEVEQRRLLPRNLDEGDSDNEADRIVELATRFLKALEGSRPLGLAHERPRDELVGFVTTQATEERCRIWESNVHNIQSLYDTYVLNTSLEDEHGDLCVLRGHASVAFHLLEMATSLVHFYARHESDVRHQSLHEMVSSLVRTEDVLHVAVNICLRQAHLAIASAEDVAHRLLETFAAVQSRCLRLPDGMTLHARPLALIVKIARHHGTPLEIHIDGDSCSGDSLMGLIMMFGNHSNASEIEFRGNAALLDDLTRLFEAGLGESGEALPQELAYLKL